MSDPRIALCSIPGCGETLRVNGRASVSVDPALRESFAVQGKPARGCWSSTSRRYSSTAPRRSFAPSCGMPAAQVDRKSLPSAGKIIADVSGGKLGRRAVRQGSAGTNPVDALLVRLRPARRQPLRHVRGHRRGNEDRVLVLVERQPRLRANADAAPVRRCAARCHRYCRQRQASPISAQCTRS